MSNLSKYWKTIIAVLGGTAAWGITAGADNSYSQVELWGLLGAIVTAVGVFAKGNTSDVPVPDESVIEPGH